MTSLLQTKAQGISGRRFAIAMASWLFAALGVLTSLMFAVAGVVSLEVVSSAFGIAILIAWSSLAVMTVRWVQDRSCYWLWPIVGSIAGLILIIMFIYLFYFYISVIPLAIYLSYWHIKRPARDCAEA